MSKCNSPLMADDPSSSSSSDSDSSDSSTVSLSDVLKPETFPLQSMDSSSDSESSQLLATNIHIQVKSKWQKREAISRFKRWKTINFDTYFREIISSCGKVKFFPTGMDTFLSTKHKRTFHELSDIGNGTFFIYLARSLIVTLNVDNSRVRVPRSLLFDACIFSEDNQVVVISVFESDTNTTRTEMYNTFVARGVTDALRTWYREDIGITNCAVPIDHNLSEEVHRLWENPSVFHIPSSLKMWRDKAEQAALALMKSVSVASSFPLLYPDKSVSDHVWFLTETEFHLLTKVIDFHGNAESAKAEVDGLLLHTEIFFRLRKRYKTALLMTSVNVLPCKLHENIDNSFRSIDEFQKNNANNKYELVITDVPVDKEFSVGESKKEKMTAIFIDVKETDETKNKRKCKTKHGSKRLEQILEDIGKVTTKKDDAPFSVEHVLPERGKSYSPFRPENRGNESGYSSDSSSVGSSLSTSPYRGRNFVSKQQNELFLQRLFGKDSVLSGSLISTSPSEESSSSLNSGTSNLGTKGQGRRRFDGSKLRMELFDLSNMATESGKSKSSGRYHGEGLKERDEGFSVQSKPTSWYQIKENDYDRPSIPFPRLSRSLHSKPSSNVGAKLPDENVDRLRPLSLGRYPSKSPSRDHVKSPKSARGRLSQSSQQ